MAEQLHSSRLLMPTNHGLRGKMADIVFSLQEVETRPRAREQKLATRAGAKKVRVCACDQNRRETEPAQPVREQDTFAVGPVSVAASIFRFFRNSHTPPAAAVASPPKSSTSV